MNKKKALYMVVTPDKYETPILLTENVNELVEKYGVTKNCIYSSIAHGASGKRLGVKFVRVYL